MSALGRDRGLVGAWRVKTCEVEASRPRIQYQGFVDIGKRSHIRHTQLRYAALPFGSFDKSQRIVLDMSSESRDLTSVFIVSYSMWYCT